jgi:hypothetical protein
VNRLYKVYLFAVFGALGGLAGSFLHQRFLLGVLGGQLAPGARLLYLALLGLLVGGAIGFVPSFLEALGCYSLRGAARSGLIGAILGAVGGMIALPLAELIHVLLGGGVLGRVVALALLGVAVGIAEGVNGGARWWRGVLGGAVGGMVAGLFLEMFLPLRATHADSGILALVLIGLFIALLIALFVNVLSEAWLEGLSGSKLSGQVYHLSKFRAPHEAIVGSDKKGTVFIWVPGAQPRHAAITLTASGTRLRNLTEAGEVRVDGAPVRERVLRDGEVVEIGGVRLRYLERRKPGLA